MDSFSGDSEADGIRAESNRYSRIRLVVILENRKAIGQLFNKSPYIVRIAQKH